MRTYDSDLCGFLIRVHSGEACSALPRSDNWGWVRCVVDGFIMNICRTDREGNVDSGMYVGSICPDCRGEALGSLITLSAEVERMSLGHRWVSLRRCNFADKFSTRVWGTWETWADTCELRGRGGVIIARGRPLPMCHFPQILWSLQKVLTEFASAVVFEGSQPNYDNCAYNMSVSIQIVV